MTKQDTALVYGGIPFLAILMTIAAPEMWVLWLIGAVFGSFRVWFEMGE